MQKMSWIFWMCILKWKYNYISITVIWFQDPVKDGEQQIRKDFEELYENMQTAFRNLED